MWKGHCPSTTYFEDCTYSGAEFHSKKSLISAQNIENKGPEFFLPPRSMVLKVVRGKIFKTLGLARLWGRLRLGSGQQQSAGRRFSPSSGWSDSAVDVLVNTMAKSGALVRLSKNAVIL